MMVTKIEQLTKTKFKVYLDGKFAFVLYKGELSRFGIREGVEIPEETVGKIRVEVILKRAKLRAMHLLADMDRTEEALREKLRLGLYPADAVEGAVRYVKSFGYLDDARYAENFVRSRQDSKSRKEIQALLLRKGVKAEQIEVAFEACYDENNGDGEQEAIRKILKKKRFSPEECDEPGMQKIYGYLARKGFRYDTVRQVIQNYNENA
ncbi:MAG TPA: recombination regulator RecX [Candidatus Mediterraneibacter intestinipullorum]|nr:recombination regulator RecX [Candidatus Mediterraneibacter intestinipullorum]